MENSNLNSNKKEKNLLNKIYIKSNPSSNENNKVDYIDLFEKKTYSTFKYVLKFWKICLVKYVGNVENRSYFYFDNYLSFDSFVDFLSNGESNIVSNFIDDYDEDKYSEDFLKQKKKEGYKFITLNDKNKKNFVEKFIVLPVNDNLSDYLYTYKENYNYLQSILLTQRCFNDDQNSLEYKLPFLLPQENEFFKELHEFEKIVYYLNCNFGVNYYGYNENLYFFNNFEKNTINFMSSDIKKGTVDVFFNGKKVSVPKFSFYTKKLYKLFGSFSYNKFIDVFDKKPEDESNIIELKKNELELLKSILILIPSKSNLLLFVNIISNDDFYLYSIPLLDNLSTDDYKIIHLLLCHYSKFDYFFSNQNTCVYSCYYHDSKYSDKYYDFYRDEILSTENRTMYDYVVNISKLYEFLNTKPINKDNLIEIIYHILLKKEKEKEKKSLLESLNSEQEVTDEASE